MALENVGPMIPQTPGDTLIYGVPTTPHAALFPGYPASRQFAFSPIHVQNQANQQQNQCHENLYIRMQNYQNQANQMQNQPTRLFSNYQQNQTQNQTRKYVGWKTLRQQHDLAEVYCGGGLESVWVRSGTPVYCFYGGKVHAIIAGSRPAAWNVFQ